MDNKEHSGRVFAKQPLLTKRRDLSYGVFKRESVSKSAKEASITENDVNNERNETRIAKLARRTSAPAELPAIKSVFPKLPLHRPRARTLSLRGEDNEMLRQQRSPRKQESNAPVCPIMICENSSADRSFAKTNHSGENGPRQRLLTGLTNNSISMNTHSLVINHEKCTLNRNQRQLVGRKGLTQEALIYHELGYAEEDEYSCNNKKDMVVRWLNSEAMNSGSRPFPQL